MPYSKQRANWLDYPTTSTPILATNLNGLETAIYELKTGTGTPGDGFTTGGVLQVGTALNLDASPKQLQTSQTVVLSGAGTTATAGISAEATVRGTGAANAVGRYEGLLVTAKDATSVANWTISGAANNGSGLIRITTSTAHTLVTGDAVGIYGVTGTTEANGRWLVTVIDTTHVDLQSSTFTNAYVSGGTLTNRGAFYGALIALAPSLTRLGQVGTAANSDDVCGIGIYNSGTGMATSGYVVNHNAAFGASSEFIEAIEIECNANYGIRMIGAYSWGIDLSGSGLATYATGAIRLPNNVSIYGRNAANTADVALLQIDTLDGLRFPNTARFIGDLLLTDGANFQLGSTTGSKLGFGATQKLGFWGVTPIVRPTGWAAATNTKLRTTFDTTTVTLPNLAARVGALMDDLIAMGLIGA